MPGNLTVMHAARYWILRVHASVDKYIKCFPLQQFLDHFRGSGPGGETSPQGSAHLPGRVTAMVSSMHSYPGLRPDRSHTRARA
jgi:hypothetical protein